MCQLWHVFNTTLARSVKLCMMLPQREAGISDVFPRLEYQGCHLIPILYLLFHYSAWSCFSFHPLLLAQSPAYFPDSISLNFFLEIGFLYGPSFVGVFTWLGDDND